MSARSCCLCLCLPKLCSTGPTSPRENFDDRKVFSAWLLKQPGHLLGSNSSLPHLASLPAKAVERGCCSKMRNILLNGEVGATQTVRHEIGKRVRIYGLYMVLFLDVTGFISSSFFFFCYIFDISLGFRVYISCPKMCSVAKSAREYAALYLRLQSLWNGFIPSDW